MARNAFALAVALLVACAGDGPTNAPRTVNGTVLTSDLVPVAGARVATRTADGWRSTTTDTNGAFTLQVDAVPYDLAVVQGTTVALFLGATRTDPQARCVPSAAALQPSASFTTTVSGDCGGAGCPPAGHEVSGQLTFSTGSASWLGTGSPPNTAGTYTASWRGPDVATGTMFALYWACPGACGSSPPDTFWLARQDGVTLQAGMTTAVPTLALAPVSSAPLIVNITLPQAAAAA